MDTNPLFVAVANAINSIKCAANLHTDKLLSSKKLIAILMACIDIITSSFDELKDAYTSLFYKFTRQQAEITSLNKQLSMAANDVLALKDTIKDKDAVIAQREEQIANHAKKFNALMKDYWKLDNFKDISLALADAFDRSPSWRTHDLRNAVVATLQRFNGEEIVERIDQPTLRKILSLWLYDNQIDRIMADQRVLDLTPTYLIYKPQQQEEERVLMAVKEAKVEVPAWHKALTDACK